MRAVNQLLRGVDRWGLSQHGPVMACCTGGHSHHSGVRWQGQTGGFYQDQGQVRPEMKTRRRTGNRALTHMMQLWMMLLFTDLWHQPNRTIQQRHNPKWILKTLWSLVVPSQPPAAYMSRYAEAQTVKWMSVNGQTGTSPWELVQDLLFPTPLYSLPLYCLQPDLFAALVSTTNVWFAIKIL